MQTAPRAVELGPGAGLRTLRPPRFRTGMGQEGRPRSPTPGPSSTAPGAVCARETRPGDHELGPPPGPRSGGT
eukprot:3551205-Karenia_brevis.AAC.1